MVGSRAMSPGSPKSAATLPRRGCSIAASLDAPRMRPSDTDGLHEPRDEHERRDADDDVDDVQQRAASEDRREHVGVAVRDADDAPVEGAADHEEQAHRLEPLQHLHYVPPEKGIRLVRIDTSITPPCVSSYFANARVRIRKGQRGPNSDGRGPSFRSGVRALERVT